MRAHVQLNDPDATEAAGRQLAAVLLGLRPDRCVCHLNGELGAGKTTFVRGVLRGLGHSGRVPSPTYTLVEPYEVAGYHVAHLDLYRVVSDSEIEFLGLAELLEPPALLLIEWPERAAAGVPPADLVISLRVSGSGRGLEIAAASAVGEGLLTAWPDGVTSRAANPQI